MGDRYIIQVKCVNCSYEDNDVYFAPTCGFIEWKCPECGTLIDLCEYTGISYEDASNLSELESIINEFKEEYNSLMPEFEEECING